MARLKKNQLSPHFTLDELTVSQAAIQKNIKNNPNKRRSSPI